jgi:BirA family biotin operon repressor/biotin-[acetyl-CoA-carboxylase] ligase
LGEELERTAVSLYESEDAALSSLDANDLVIKIVCHMSALISALPDRSYLEYYRAHSLLDGRDVVVHQAGGQFEAHVIGIDDDAHLVVEDREGRVHTLSSAEITIRLAR